MAFGSKAPKIGARAMPKNVSAKPKFPTGARPLNVAGPHINEHPGLLGGGSSTNAGRIYSKPKDGQPFDPFGGL